MDSNLSGLVDDLAATCDLPPLPAAAARALALARDPDSSSEDLARVVATDPALAARVLAMSRSVTYLRRQPPRTLQEAIATVGLRALRRILIAASARAAYRADDRVAQSLWAHSLATALAADEIGKTIGGVAAGDAFIAGLLHDIGKLVMHLSNPKAFATLGVFDETTERSLFGTTHAEVGGRLAEKWGLEVAIAEGIRAHHEANPSPLAVCVARADRIAMEIGYGSLAHPESDGADGREALDAELEAAAERVRVLFESERHLFD
ncbi:MAG: HDOD domain-containing protein [Deltaproteobacteria bacterium]|nr:HDOD domain-containing protein [Deltaproteobacteria bacterium]